MTTHRSTNKNRLHEFSHTIRDTTPESVRDVIAEYYHEDAEWHGPAPIDRLEGRAAIESEFWEPLLTAFPDLEKNDYILFGGEFEGEEWVCATGNLVGTFENEWLEVPPTGHATWLRYGEFHRFEDGKIAETRLLIDILDVLRQAGYRLFPSLAPEVVIPGPTTQDGVLLGDQDGAESQQTLQLVEDMIFDGLHSYEDEEDLEKLGMERYWHEDFMWYGPAGTGTTRGIDGFQDFHQGPFLEAFPDREGANHVSRFAEGKYCASTGWPSIHATHTGDGWLGLPATGESVTMRVMDFWRREDDLLAENWVFIDMIDLLDQIGVDVFGRIRNDSQYF
ncbi:ester cyclase [Haloarcula sp. 1CSR25-25]|uniref:ester cyclase n=1 Tax=Haloarcula sp. 1CSR25-25 TaxID=2862545 RepID=UPI002893F3D6|nr:ester cyclase [Haloarcula sp. 1CSR25-25]MDT3437169.1 ester cyclase [Haloarcula sp. 1CSR25-25]